MDGGIERRHENEMDVERERKKRDGCVRGSPTARGRWNRDECVRMEGSPRNTMGGGETKAVAGTLNAATVQVHTHIRLGSRFNRRSGG